MENKSKFEEEFSTVLSNIAYSAVTKQNINTIKYYKIPLLNDEKDTVVINKKEDKYKISIDSFEWRIVKRSDVEALEVLLTICNLLIKSQKQ